MNNRLDVLDLMKKNPHIDPQQLQESMELLQGLRDNGVSGRDYRLAPPCAGRRVRVIDNGTSEDSRPVLRNRT